MNKITYFIISVIISVITGVTTLFTDPENFYCWLAFVIIILLAPVIFYKITINKPNFKKHDALLLQTLILCIVLIFAARNILPCDDDYMVAITESPTKANEIQEVLTTKNRPTKRHIAMNTNDTQKISYGISVKNQTKKQNRLVTLELLNSDIFDESIVLAVNVKYTKNRLKLLKRVQNEYENILYQIDGIKWVTLTLVPPENIDDDNARLKSVLLRYETDETADSEKIKKQVENLINSSFKPHCSNITIEDLTCNEKAYSLFDNAQKEFENHNYVRAINLIVEASELNNYYSKYIDTIPKIIELDKKIKKDKKNYQYYIEKGDLLRSFSTCLYCNSESIKNYEKALELNPNAHEVYEKIGHAYANMMFEYSILADFSTDTKEKELEQKCREKRIEYYLKALEYTEGNYPIYATLGHYYFENKDYNTALKYYNKINPSEDLSCKSNISNKKVFSYWKTGHYIEAYKETKNCSVWLCKLIRMNFAPSDDCVFNN